MKQFNGYIVKTHQDSDGYIGVKYKFENDFGAYVTFGDTNEKLSSSLKPYNLNVEDYDDSWDATDNPMAHGTITFLDSEDVIKLLNEIRLLPVRKSETKNKFLDILGLKTCQNCKGTGESLSLSNSKISVDCDVCFGRGVVSIE